MCAALGDDPLPMYEIIYFSIALLHFVLFHNVTCYTNSFLLRIHVKLLTLHNSSISHALWLPEA